MYCINCGAQLQNGAKFCSECGTAVSTFLGPAPGPNTSVDQHVHAVEGTVVGLAADTDFGDTMVDIGVTQKIDVVKGGGTVVGVTFSPTGHMHVGGQEVYGDVVHGSTTEVRTGGGAYVGGSVTAGSDFVGRDAVQQSDTLGEDEVLPNTTAE